MFPPAFVDLATRNQSKGTQPKLTDEERHKRFLAEAKKAEASDKDTDFDNAFSRVVSKPKEPSPKI